MRKIFILSFLALGSPFVALSADESLSAQCIEEYKAGHLEKALYYCHGAATHPQAQYILGKIYSLEGMNSAEMKKAYEYFAAAANQNHPEAQLTMALCYQNGLGVEQNSTTAAYWYQQALTNGLEGPDLDPQRTRPNQTLSLDALPSADELETAAEKGLAEAQYQLGLAYSFGKGVTPNNGKALAWLNRAAQQNHQGAQSYLAWMSLLGLGKPANKEEAIQWFLLAAQESTSLHNHPDLLDELLFSNKEKHSFHDRLPESEYMQGVELIEARFNEQDLKDGLTLLEKAADEKYAPAQLYLAKLYHEGTLVQKDLSKAVKFYTDAAYNGNPEAQYALGWMYFYGEGVAQNDDTAFEWFSLANEREARAKDALQFMLTQREVVELGNHKVKRTLREKFQRVGTYFKTLIPRRQSTS